FEVDENGGYRFLLQGKNNLEGKAYVWSTDDEGVIESGSGWKSGSDLLPLELEFNVDLNNDGEIGTIPLTIIEEDGTAAFAKDDTDTYWIVNNDTEEQLQLKNSRGRTYTDSTTARWDGVAVEVDENGGYRFLLQGKNNLEGKAYVWSTDDEGVIEIGSGWKSGSDLLPFESEFNVDLNNDGEIGTIPLTIIEEDGTAAFAKDDADNYWIVNNDTQQQLQLQSDRGRTYTDSTTTNWDGVAVEIDDEGGYRFLLDGENDREGQGYVWSINDQGVIEIGSGWKSGSDLLPFESEFNVDLNNDGIIGSF
ncbi:MAG: hypothetical protein F6K17_40770, partial [Okeania sp. SIO3C4]|nr:hypothetical protein [Okeania sp. SIO3C4]